MFCINCGAKIADDSKFCEQCGSMQGAKENIINEKPAEQIITEAEEILAEASLAEVAPVLEIPKDVVEDIKEDIAKKEEIVSEPILEMPTPEAPSINLTLEAEPVLDSSASNVESATGATANFTQNTNQNAYQNNYTVNVNNNQNENYFAAPKKKSSAVKIVAIVLAAILLLGAVGFGLSQIGFGGKYKSAEAVMDKYFQCLEKNDTNGVRKLMEPDFNDEIIASYDTFEEYLESYDYGYAMGYFGEKIDKIEYESIMALSEEETKDLLYSIDMTDSNWTALEEYYAYVTFADGTEDYFDILVVEYKGSEYLIFGVQ